MTWNSIPPFSRDARPMRMPCVTICLKAENLDTATTTGSDSKPRCSPETNFGILSHLPRRPGNFGVWPWYEMAESSLRSSRPLLNYDAISLLSPHLCPAAHGEKNLHPRGHLKTAEGHRRQTHHSRVPSGRTRLEMSAPRVSVDVVASAPGRLNSLSPSGPSIQAITACAVCFYGSGTQVNSTPAQRDKVNKTSLKRSIAGRRATPA